MLKILKELNLHKGDLNNFDDFWIKIRDGENLEKGTPTYKLRGELITNYENKIKKLNYKQIYIKIINSWNAYLKGAKRYNIDDDINGVEIKYK